MHIAYKDQILINIKEAYKKISLYKWTTTVGSYINSRISLYLYYNLSHTIRLKNKQNKFKNYNNSRIIMPSSIN